MIQEPIQTHWDTWIADIGYKGNEVEVINNNGEFVYDIDQSIDDPTIIMNSKGEKMIEETSANSDLQ